MNNQPKITLKKGLHKNQNIIQIEFPYNLQAMDLLRQNTSATRNRIIECRYIPELVGQESSDTIEIYTLVSQNDFNKFKNPMDDMILEDNS